MSLAEMRREARRVRGGRGRDAGRFGEHVAALWLMLHGWRIVGFRRKTRRAEIDLLAIRAGVLAVVEVKRRPTLDEAARAVGAEQRRRLAEAGRAIQARTPAYAALSVRLDMVALAPGRLPRHIAGLDAAPRGRRP